MPELFNSSPDTATQGFTPPPAANDERYDNVVAFSVAEQAGDTADATAQYAESFLPEGTLDIAGHGFAEVPQQDLAPELAAETTPTSLDINLDELTPPNHAGYRSQL